MHSATPRPGRDKTEHGNGISISFTITARPRDESGAGHKLRDLTPLMSSRQLSLHDRVAALMSALASVFAVTLP